MRRPKPDPTSPASAGEVAHSAGEGAPGTSGEVRSARVAGYALLAGRDFSVHEMTERLLRKGHDAAVVEAAVAILVQEGFLREERFAEQYVVRHAGRGHGPVRIRMELREKGVPAETIDEALAAAETDWIEAARSARRRKFGASSPGDFRERAKQARFLQYRGFSSEQIRAAFGPDDDKPAYDDPE